MWLEESITPEVCQKAAALGFNAIMVSDAAALACVKQSPLKSVWNGEEIHEAADLVFAEFKEDKDYERLPVELALEQATRLAACKRPLIFFVSAQNPWIAKRQSLWLEVLADDFKVNCSIAFSALAGAGDAYHLPLHPFWEKVRHWDRQTRRASYVIVDVSGPGKGQWPTLMAPYFDRILPRIKAGNFSGIIIKACRLAEEGSVLQRNLESFVFPLLHKGMAEEYLYDFYQTKVVDFGMECFQIALKAAEMEEGKERKLKEDSIKARLKELASQQQHPLSLLFPQFLKDIKNKCLQN